MGKPANMLTQRQGELVKVAAAPVQADRHPVRVYLARLAAGSRRTMAQALEKIAKLATAGHYSAEELPWHTLRYQHTQGANFRSSCRPILAAVCALLSSARPRRCVGSAALRNRHGKFI